MRRFLMNNGTLVPGPRKADKNAQKVDFTRVSCIEFGHAQT